LSAAQLVARLAQEGIDPTLLAEVAQELFAGEIERKTLEQRRENERNRKSKSRSVTGSHVTKRDRTGQPVTPPRGSPKERNQTPSLPPALVSEPDGSSPEPRPWALPVGVSLQVWDDFLTNRRRKRLPNTETAWKGFNDDLKRVSAQTGIPPPKLITQCTAKGWGAIYDPKDEPNVRRTDTMGRHQSTDGLSSTARAALSVFGR
jgi:hypothetical protein